MKILSASPFVFLLFVFSISAQAGFAQSKPYTPAKGSAERKAILDGVRTFRKAPEEVYTPTTFNVQNGWAVIYTRDPNDPEVDTAAVYVLLHKTGKSWKVVADLMAVEGSNGSKEIKAARKKYPAAPAAIFIEK